MMKNSEKTMDKIIALCKNRGFVFAGSEIYGGLANSWDYGPLGVEFKNNVKKAWPSEVGEAAVPLGINFLEHIEVLVVAGESDRKSVV